MNRLTILLLSFIFLIACKNRQEPESLLPPPDSVLALVSSDPSSLVISKQIPIRAGALSGSEIKEETFTGYTERNQDLDIAVAPLTNGRIERVYFFSEGEWVNAGQKLFDYYSPEINSFQKQFILAIKKGDTEMQNQLEIRLKLLGFPPQLLQELKTRKEPFFSIPYFSPASGYLSVPGNLSPTAPENDQVTTGGMANMKSSGPDNPFSSATQNNRLPVAEEYFNKGDELYLINNNSSLWITFYLPPTTEESLEVLNVTTNSGAGASARVLQKEPVTREGSEFISVRAELKNSGNRFKTGEVFSLSRSSASSGKGVIIPSRAVLDLGTRMIVWKATTASDGVYIYQASEVTTEPAGPNLIRVIDGLDRGELISSSAGFMTDVQSLIQPDDHP